MVAKKEQITVRKQPAKTEDSVPRILDSSYGQKSVLYQINNKIKKSRQSLLCLFS